MPLNDLAALPGWVQADHAAALSTYLKTAKPDDPAHGVQAADARRYLEDRYRAEEVAAGAVMTGYFEPEYEGALVRSEAFPAPVYAPPRGWRPGDPYASRAEIDAGDLLRGREIAWLRTPLDCYLMQVQGSGRVRLEDGTVLRLGFGGKNGRPYTSLGKLLVARGHLSAQDATMQSIRTWYGANLLRGDATLRENESFVFFKSLDGLDPDEGPVGTAGVSLDPMLSIAVDPACTPLGSFVWVAPEQAQPPAALCVAQDTGSAIKGRGRVDLFCGSGREAGELAGRLHTAANVFHLVPREDG